MFGPSTRETNLVRGLFGS